jgi:hypothetical protein
MAHINDTPAGAADNGGVEDDADCLGLGVLAGQGEDPRAFFVGPCLLGVDAALAHPVVELGQDHVGPVDLVADGGEVLPDRAEVGAPVDGVSQQPGGVRLVRVGAGAGVPAQLGLEVRADRAGLDEADQAAGEVRFLGPGGQPDGQPPGGQVVDDGAAAVGVGDAVVDEAFVHGQVRERPGFGQPVAGSSWRCYAVIGLTHESLAFPGMQELGRRLAGDVAEFAVLGAASCRSVGCLAVRLLAGLFLLTFDVAGRLGGPRDRIWRGQAEFSCPALDVRPEPVALVDVAVSGGVGQGHRGDRDVTVQDLARQPGHFPTVLAAGRLPGGVGGVVAGHGGVGDGQGHGCSLPGRGHGSASRCCPALKNPM